MFELSLAIRFLREGKVQTVLILIGICVGIAVQIFLSSLIGGLQKDLVNRTVGRAPHITVTMPEQRPQPVLTSDSVVVVSRVVTTGEDRRPIRRWAPLVRELEQTGWFSVVSPVVDGAGFVFKGEQSLPVVIRGVRIDKADAIYNIRGSLREGTAIPGGAGILIGTELATKLRVRAGGSIRIATAGGTGDYFTVQGIFDLESQQVNESWVFMPLGRAQIVCGMDAGVSAVELQIADVFSAQAVSRRLARSFPEYAWVSWQESNANLLAALKSQSGSSNLIQVLVLLAVTLGISSVLAVSAMQKARQIGILKAMGASHRSIGRVFLIMGAVLGFAGALAGCGAGYWLITAFLSATARSTGKPLFPLAISPVLYAVSAFIATAAGTVAAFIPARRSSRLNPIEVIRNG